MSNPRFSIIPAGAVTDRTLEPRDLQVLCLLGRHTDKAGWCSRSQVKMASEIDCSRASLQNSLERLYGAGWVQKKRRDLEVEEAGKQPSRSYAYRVLLDRDDYAFEATVHNLETDEGESYAESASDEGGCQPVGTPVPTPGVGTGANTYVGTSNVPFEPTPSERERDARARDRKARFLVDFEKRWPSAASDNRQRTAYAADALTEIEEEAALAGIAPFLENQKRLHRKNVPAGWRYLEEKRWTLLEAAKETVRPKATKCAKDSFEALAVCSLYAVARSRPFEHKGSIVYPGEITPQILAFGDTGEHSKWVAIESYRQVAGARTEFLNASVFGARPALGLCFRAPWPWPPSIEGKIYTTGPPQPELTEQDMADFK